MTERNIMIVKHFVTEEPNIQTSAEIVNENLNNFSNFNQFYTKFVNETRCKDTKMRRFVFQLDEHNGAWGPFMIKTPGQISFRPVKSSIWNDYPKGSTIEIYYKGHPRHPDHDPMDLDSEIVPELVRSMHNRILNLEIKMKENNGKYLRQE